MALSLHSWHSVRLMAHGQWGPARPRCPGAAVGPNPAQVEYIVAQAKARAYPPRKRRKLTPMQIQQEHAQQEQEEMDWLFQHPDDLAEPFPEDAYQLPEEITEMWANARADEWEADALAAQAMHSDEEPAPPRGPSGAPPAPFLFRRSPACDATTSQRRRRGPRCAA